MILCSTVILAHFCLHQNGYGNVPFFGLTMAWSPGGMEANRYSTRKKTA
jgi:hypothetical protein